MLDKTPNPLEVWSAADFGSAVRQWRRAKGWNQSQLAAWLDCHRVTVAKLEHGGAVSLPFAMRALTLLGTRIFIADKQTDPRRVQL